ncbi:MAG TPA: DUF1707 and FHA domain-containing protein [Acidothermaceae bacterium]
MTSVTALRASDDDRERVVATLREASIAGRISHDTFVERVEAALAARRRDELAVLVDDVRPARTRFGARVEHAVSTVSAFGFRLQRAWRAPRLPCLRLPAGQSTVSLGRAPDQDLRLDHPTVSRRHALLRRTATGWEVVDLCSMNGTRVNGYRVVGAHQLRPGDVVSFGELAMTVA